MFILISTVMTWARTKPEEADGPEPVFSEEDVTRRRPHPSFRKHKDLEKLVLKLAKEKKSKLTCYVVAAGLQYGMEEDVFHYFFKVSWLMQLPKVPIFGNGTNYIPTIHVYDLGGVVQNVLQLRPKTNYILAVDHSRNTLGDIVKTISDVLGPEEVHKMSLQDVVTMKAVTTQQLDCLSIDLCLDAVMVNDLLNLSWTCPSGMVENMENIVQEYKDCRQLLPVKLCLLGPPAVGKSTVAEKLCQYYRIHHVHVHSLLEETDTQRQEKRTGADPEHEASAAGNMSLETTEGQLDEQQICEILQEKLESKVCRNHGFVLEGFPHTYDQAKRIFSAEEPETQDSEPMSRTPWYNKIITPEHVFALDASDDFLTRRVQALPESVAEKTHLTQDRFLPRLQTFRRLNRAEDTLLDFFHQREIHPQHIDVSTDDPECTHVLKKIKEIVGVPKNYGASPEEQEEEEQRRAEERRQSLAAEAVQRKHSRAAALVELAAQHEDWHRNLLEVRRQQGELLGAQALPLRNYLMKHVMPSLTQAMSECCRVKPHDPVDFLAEHLLHNNEDQH
ncbi:adenylate kinase 7 [Austrofundulus limnaeus]|uniref:Adenylate kinase 7 n=1 Tax=Austrofundulus limnaeus TaxID=52670 RepID=A0A2I4BSY5_AUSLI|nr:PREDICTED: adenylate kinase 7-like [Austrofundulus limnaeus]